MFVVGIDIGGSTTKTVAVQDKEIKGFSCVRNTDPVSAASGSLGKLLYSLGRGLDDVDAIALTGVGSKKISGKIFEFKPIKVDEITSIGLGGLYLSGKSKALVVSVGTGTAMVAARQNGEIIHVGGTGVGGGTLVGLGRCALNKSSIKSIEKLAEKGRLEKVNLTVFDLAGGPVGEISENATASNFGKIGDDFSHEDVAVGIINMVAEVIGTVSVMAARCYSLEKDIVFVGMVLQNKLFREHLFRTLAIFRARGIVPRNADYCSAVGAALHVEPRIRKNKNRELGN